MTTEEATGEVARKTLELGNQGAADYPESLYVFLSEWERGREKRLRVWNKSLYGIFEWNIC